MEINNTNQVLSQEEVFDKFKNLVKFAAKQISDNANMSGTMDCYVDVQDLYQEGMILLYNCWLKYNSKPMAEFKTIFSSSLFRFLNKKAKRTPAINIDIEEAYDIGYNDTKLESMYMEYGMQQLTSLLQYDYIALAILHELLDPSDRTVWEMNMDTARKQTLKSQDKRVNIPQNTNIKMLHIKRALELSQKEFDEGIARLRAVARGVFKEETFTMAY